MTEIITWNVQEDLVISDAQWPSCVLSEDCADEHRTVTPLECLAQ